MAATYNGTDVTSVPDKPSGFSQTAIVEVTADYVKTYAIIVGKAGVDTSDDVTNFTALIAAVDVAVLAEMADFAPLKTVTGSGKVTSFNLDGGTKYGTDNTPEYTCNVETKINVA